jgi:hypothetical protein
MNKIDAQERSSKQRALKAQKNKRQVAPFQTVDNFDFRRLRTYNLVALNRTFPQ